MSLNINQIYNALAVNGRVNVDRNDHYTVDKTGGVIVRLNIGGQARQVKLREMTFAAKLGLKSNDLGEVQKARNLMDHINVINSHQHGFLPRIHRLFDAVLVRLHLLADRITHRSHNDLPIPQVQYVRPPRPIIPAAPLRNMLIEKTVELSTGQSSPKFVIEMSRNWGMLQNPTSTLTVYLNQARPKELAWETLKALTALDCSEITKIQIKQANSQAYDMGGVSRQFFCDLFTDLVTTPPGNAYFDMTSGFAVPKFPRMPADPESMKFFQDVGKVLALCFRCKVQIGEVFGREVFSIISKMSRDPLYSGESLEANATQMAELDPSLKGPLPKYLSDLEKLNDDELAAFCHQFPQMEPKDGEGLDRKGKMAAIVAERVKDLQAIYGDDIDPGSTPEQFMEEAKKLLMSDHEESIKPIVTAMFEMLKAMRKVLSPVVLQDGKALGDKILGEPMDARVLVNRIRFNIHSDMPVEKQEWIKNAIGKFNQKQVEGFLYCTTGSKGLFPGAVISFYHMPGQDDKISTCSRTVTFDSSKMTNQEEMDQFIRNLANSSANTFNAI